jgi:hypothetical protein
MLAVFEHEIFDDTSKVRVLGAQRANLCDSFAGSLYNACIAR